MVIIFGLGFTGQYVAERMLEKGIPVCAAVRNGSRFSRWEERGLTLFDWSETDRLPREALLVHTIPPLDADANAILRGRISALAPRRLVYVSSTGVYGEQAFVDESTPVAPSGGNGLRRVEEEDWISGGPWTSLILRAAAIYGPFRGVHTAIRGGRTPRGQGIVSRIHVRDLAALIDAGLFSTISGAWPVADEQPCASEEIAAWYRTQVGLGSQPAYPPLEIKGRCVNGTALRERLGLILKYPSWKTGIPASIAEEQREFIP